jgi:hypothetical protein
MYRRMDAHRGGLSALYINQLTMLIPKSQFSSREYLASPSTYPRSMPSVYSVLILHIGAKLDVMIFLYLGDIKNRSGHGSEKNHIYQRG